MLDQRVQVGFKQNHIPLNVIKFYCLRCANHLGLLCSTCMSFYCSQNKCYWSFDWGKHFHLISCLIVTAQLKTTCYAAESNSIVVWFS